MSFSAGDKLGPYEIFALIGKGGMGEVYRAKDSRLNREVAIKISAAQFTERFEHEAKAIAALNHRHICQLYDVGPNYLVMEYIEGSPLKGPLQLDKALEYAAQIASALDAAHSKRITHRDLKPANILLTKEGIKLLDFGLSKTESPISAGAETLTMSLTRHGQILGTLLYMSPEQINGKETGPQSDIFSFGLVLYEMLKGKRAFQGSTPASIMGAILERPAPSISDVAPPALDRLLKRCLEKDPQDRWQSARDLKSELEWIASVTETERTTPSQSLFGSLPWAIAAAMLAVIAAVALGALWRAKKPADLNPLVQLNVDLGSEVALGSVNGPDVILSPDSTRLVYVSHAKLLTRRLDQPGAGELAGTEGAFAPFFSPDSEWVGFFAGGKLKKISVQSGAAITLCDAASGGGGSWGDDGNIIAALDNTGILSRIASTGGIPTPVTELAQGELNHYWPQVLPGGRAVLFTANTAVGRWDRANIVVTSLGDHRRKTVQQGGTFGRYIATSKAGGHLVYVNGGTLFAVWFDVNALAVRGTPVPILEDVLYSTTDGFARLDFAGSSSGHGTLVYRSGGTGDELYTVQWLDTAGKTRPLLAKPGFYVRPKLSPDGQRLALAVTEGASRSIRVYDWQRNTMARLTFGAEPHLYPTWTPDSRYIVFSGPAGMFWVRSDGAGKPQQLTESNNPQWPWSLTPDGKRLAFQERKSGAGWDLWTVPLESDGAGLRAGKPEVFLQTKYDERQPSFSPDGRWLAYSSNESGTFQIYARAYPDKGGQWQISTNGGEQPVWSRNGRDLFFRTEGGLIMVASYTVNGDSLVSDMPRVWAEKQLTVTGRNGIYDLAPDGKRIATLMRAEGTPAQQPQNHVIFLENFFDVLRRRVPAPE